MAVLNSKQRSDLEKAVVKARRLSLTGATNALQAFAVHHHEPYSHMSPDDRDLRVKLRTKARLLGDVTTTDGGHTIDKLAYELAYEYWHRMLFARFLEANHLLMHPEHEIAVTLEECEELGKEEGFDDKWQAASYYASKMLPAIFRQEDPLMQLRYATEDRLALEQLLEQVEQTIFVAEDSLGWVYQYWQSEAKEAINASGDKIDGAKLPAVTQLFTEPYMVHFLIDNTLGAWWTARNPNTVSPVAFTYLRTLEDDKPAAGSYEGWPNSLKEITMLDPSMGSGHFIVEVFKKMAELRKHDENLTKEEACDVTISDNIHGLELDDRCTQIAAFNLALTAWKYCGKYRILPEMNLACSGIAPKGKKSDWVKLADSEEDAAKQERLRGGLARMYELFQNAPILGSLIDPTLIQADVFTSDFDEIWPFLKEALTSEEGKNEKGVIAAGIAKAGKLLAKRYVLQITNVPYLSRSKQFKTLYEFCETHYSKGKSDLATVFYDKMLKSTVKGGTACSVIPQNWLFLTSYKEFRKELLKKYRWNIVSRLGAKSFQTPMWDFNVMLISITNENPQKDDSFAGIDVSEYESVEEKQIGLNKEKTKTPNQNRQILNPDCRIVFDILEHTQLLNEYVRPLQGIATGDFNRFGQLFFELSSVDNINWVFQQSTVSLPNLFGGKSNILHWEDGMGDLYNSDGARIQGLDSKKSNGVAVSQMANLPCAISLSTFFDNNCAVLLPLKDEFLLPIWTYCSSDTYLQNVRQIDQKKSVTNATLAKVPFDLEHWQKVAKEKYPNGLPKPYSDDPTQWLFHGHPKHTDSPLQVGIARLMGYQWPAEQDKEMELSEEATTKIEAIHALDLPFDEDGIVCIPSANKEPAAAERLRENIIKIWGDEYDGNTIAQLLEQEGSKKKDLENYLRDDFWVQHCKLFKNRPFIWHIWDGRKDGFAVLMNYHQLNKGTLEKLIYTYLNDWINQCQLKLENDISGADGLLSAAKALKDKLVFILEGEPPYDIFVRWKSAAEQPIGWEPDINDGVRMNIYPFVQAGILRKNFNVKWKKDRGKNPSGSHWGPERFNRYEDLAEEHKLKDAQKNIIPHLTNAIKRKARENNE